MPGDELSGGGDGKSLRRPCRCLSLHSLTKGGLQEGRCRWGEEGKICVQQRQDDSQHFGVGHMALNEGPMDGWVGGREGGRRVDRRGKEI